MWSFTKCDITKQKGRIIRNKEAQKKCKKNDDMLTNPLYIHKVSFYAYYEFFNKMSNKEWYLLTF